jgi:hypothetical protein
MDEKKPRPNPDSGLLSDSTSTDTYTPRDHVLPIIFRTYIYSLSMVLVIEMTGLCLLAGKEES